MEGKKGIKTQKIKVRAFFNWHLKWNFCCKGASLCRNWSCQNIQWLLMFMFLFVYNFTLLNGFSFFLFLHLGKWKAVVCQCRCKQDIPGIVNWEQPKLLAENVGDINITPFHHLSTSTPTRIDSNRTNSRKPLRNCELSSSLKSLDFACGKPVP